MRYTVIPRADGSIRIPEELLEKYGWDESRPFQIEASEEGVFVSGESPYPRRVNIEVTNRCGLMCKTCMRNEWQEDEGDMDGSLFSGIAEEIAGWPRKPKVFFGGLGEPMSHPDIVSFVGKAAAAGCVTELITSGILLDRESIEKLRAAGLKRIWISLDGGSAEGCSDIRAGEFFPRIMKNLELLGSAVRRHPGRGSAEGGFSVGIATVIMKKNLRELPKIVRIAQNIGADRIVVTNVNAHTTDLRREILYEELMGELAPIAPRVELPRLDPSDDTMEVIRDLLRMGALPEIGAHQGSPGREPQTRETQDRNFSKKDQCPFMDDGSISIRRDGEVSPCIPLLHSHQGYLNDHPRSVSHYSFGSFREKPLSGIWNSPGYAQFRRRLKEFDFSPCTLCDGCDYSHHNLEDCFGNTGLTCGGCLWAQGFIRCP